VSAALIFHQGAEGNAVRPHRCSYALLLLCATTAIALHGQTFTTLHSFDGTDGKVPEAGLVQATNGNLYGTAGSGGANGDGTIFKITPSGTLTMIYSFCQPPNRCTDGAYPFAGLIQATDGDFYGTTAEGGANGHGTVFKISPSGTLATLHSFCSENGCADGQYPDAVLVQAVDGDFYGTTYSGGANGFGTVFKINPSGALTTLHSFCSESGCTDGQYPDVGLVQAIDGNLYGITYAGGASGDGTVFKMTPSGKLTTLHSFDSTDGQYPLAGLVQATDGSFYGTTDEGGAAGFGTVFKITASGTLTTLHSFDSTDGAEPSGALVQAADGSFYGTTAYGGASNFGTAFKITASGTLATLHSFGSGEGIVPYTGLIQDTNGTFYGTTVRGGADNHGTLFSLSVGLGPFVETQTTSGNVGAAVEILGTDLTGATSVSFNGTAATFTVVSRSLITTTVPAGATTGKVQVVTQRGMLSSNMNFRVTP